MEKFYTFLFLGLLAWSKIANAQNLNFLWAKQLGGVSEDIGSSVTVDLNGNVITTGEFNGTADFNPSTDPNTGTFNLTSLGYQDIFVSKLDASGNFLWAKQIGGAFTDRARSVTADADGNIYITGNFSGTVDFDPGPSIYNLTGSGSEDIFIAKLDPSGNLLWAKQLGGNSHDIGFSIAVNSIGNVSVTGYFRNTVDFDPGSGTYNLTASGITTDIFIVTLDASGNFLWAVKMGGGYDDEAYSITVDEGGNVYTTGYFRDVADFDPGPGTYNLTTLNPINNPDTFVSKLDASGNFVWAKQLGGSFIDTGYSIKVDASGNVFTAGVFWGMADFNPSPNGVYNLTSAGNERDIFISKLNALGDFVWAKKMGGSFEDYGYSIFIDVVGNIYTTGTFTNTADFDPGEATYNLTAAGQEDIFISKLNPSGDFEWAKQMGGGLEDRGNSIFVDANENVYITGRFFSTVDFDPGNATFNLSPVYFGAPFIYSDVFIEKLCQLETPTVTVSGSTSFCQGDSVILSAPVADAYLWSNGETTQNIVVKNSGNYAVTVFSSSGCSASSVNTTVIVSSLPSTPSITSNGPTTFCQGGSVTLTASSASSYHWSTGATTQSITVSNSGDYDVTISNASGCNASSLITTVTVLSVPPVPSITADGPVSFCQGNSVTLTASSANSYLWSNGATDQSITVSTAGDYTVTITAGNGCSAASEVTTIVVNPYPPVPTITADGSTTFCQGDSVKLTASSANSYLWSNGATTQSITVLDAGDYSVTISDTNGCNSASSINTITVHPSPAAPSVTADGPTIFCQGESVILTSSNADDYLWNNGESTQSITVTTPGDYSVMISDVNGCTAASSATQVIVNPAPTVDLGPDAVSLEQGQELILSAEGQGLSYLWSTNENTDSIIVTTAGTYSVTVANSFGCTAMDSVVVSIITNINSPIEPYRVIVFPNPAQHLLNVKYEGKSNSIQSILLFDSFGREINSDIKIDPDGTTGIINLGDLPGGIYFVKVSGKLFSKIFQVAKL